METEIRQNTLMRELSGWNRQEGQFRELFGETSLKDREFLKMKLDNYTGLFHKYNGNAQTTDERALLLMLRYQRRKMEKTLYPGLLRRMIYRAAARLKAQRLMNRKPVQASTQEGFNLPPIPVRQEQAQQQQKQQATVRQMPFPKQQMHGSMRRKQQKGRHKGHSL